MPPQIVSIERRVSKFDVRALPELLINASGDGLSRGAMGQCLLICRAIFPRAVSQIVLARRFEKFVRR